MAGLNKFASAKDQLIFVRCDPCLNTVLATKLLHRSIKLPRLSAHDLGATMGEDGASNACCFAPAKLLDNWRVANQSPALFANHRSPDRCTIADIQVHPSQSGGRVGKRGNVRHIKEISAFGRYAITDSGSPDGMLHRNCLKFQLTDGRDASRLTWRSSAIGYRRRRFNVSRVA